MLGPTIIYTFAICLIISHKCRYRYKYSLQPTEKHVARQVELVITSAVAFAHKSKFGELYFESIPQFLTQFLMTSAKGDEGVRSLTNLQILSIVGSAISISLGLSDFNVPGECNDATDTLGGEADTDNQYDNFFFVSQRHSALTARIVMIMLVLSELAFYGGIARFAFASPSYYFMYPFFLLFLWVFLHLMSSRQFLKRTESNEISQKKLSIAVAVIKGLTWVRKLQE